MTNPYDFSNLSDLPDDLQKAMNTETADKARAVADIVTNAKAHGIAELNVNEVRAVAIRTGFGNFTQATIRGYLNRAVDLGLIVKPSRQTYAAAGDASGGTPTPTPDEVDPLAGL